VPTKMQDTSHRRRVHLKGHFEVTCTSEEFHRKYESLPVGARESHIHLSMAGSSFLPNTHHHLSSPHTPPPSYCSRFSHLLLRQNDEIGKPRLCCCCCVPSQHTRFVRARVRDVVISRDGLFFYRPCRGSKGCQFQTHLYGPAVGQQEGF
jgi:hypothetical protein